MVIGIGADIVEISRMERILSQYGNRFRDRVFTPREIASCELYARQAERYATRFAAKEAARKAIGAAIPLTALAWHDVEIISSTEGAPQLEFHGRAADLIKQIEVTRTHVSLSHAVEHAIAFVILEGE
jgi:holo-[acyl-carrier protein] synthase